MTRWLVTGAGGQLGRRLVERLSDAGEDVVGLARADLDLTSSSAVAAAVAAVAPDVVVNAAAYTRVDDAETNEAEAYAVNGAGPGHLAGALAARATGRLLHVSTDYVFDGAAGRPYRIDDRIAPRTAYGRTKAAGEHAVRAALADRSCVVRSAWVYGGPGPNFVDTMIRLERERDTVDVVDDEIGSPTYVADLAGALVELGRRPDLTGVQHYANAGQASWFDLARATFRGVGADPERVRPTTSAAFARPAPRPAWSVLSTEAWTAAGLAPPRPWADGLAAHLATR